MTKRCPRGYHRVGKRCRLIETPEMRRIRNAGESGEIEWDKYPIDFAYEQERRKAYRQARRK